MPRKTLKTQSSSSSTICYTVSDAPSRASSLAQLLHLVDLIFRILVAVLCLLTIIVQCRPTLAGSGTIWQVEGTLQGLVAGTAGARFSSKGDRWWIGVLFAGLVAWGCTRRGHVEESLLIIRGLGVQTSTSSPSYLSTPTTRFIPTAHIQDILIHEAFIGFEVKFYLSVIVDGEEEAVVVFPKLLPRREVLEEVWRGARGVLGWSKA